MNFTFESFFCNSELFAFLSLRLCMYIVYRIFRDYSNALAAFFFVLNILIQLRTFKKLSKLVPAVFKQIRMRIRLFLYLTRRPCG